MSFLSLALWHFLFDNKHSSAQPGAYEDGAYEGNAWPEVLLWTGQLMELCVFIKPRQALSSYTIIVKWSVFQHQELAYYLSSKPAYDAPPHLTHPRPRPHPHPHPHHGGYLTGAQNYLHLTVGDKQELPVP